jgi:hypothetical protein
MLTTVEEKQVESLLRRTRVVDASALTIEASVPPCARECRDRSYAARSASVDLLIDRHEALLLLRAGARPGSSPGKLPRA